MESKADVTTYILDVDHRHSPSYVAGLSEINPASVMQTPKVLAIPGSKAYAGQDDEVFHCTSFKLLDDEIPEQRRLLVPDTMMREAEVSSLGRHFLIPFPGSFLDSTSLTRGGIQKSNPYAVLVNKLLETIEFLLSADGIHLCWNGTLAGEILPEAEWNRRTDAKNNELPVRPMDKISAQHTTKLYSSETENPLCAVFDELINAEQPLLEANPFSIQMHIHSVDEEYEVTVVNKCDLYWEFLPLVEADFGFDDETKVLFKEQHMFDKDSDVGCINKHFKINDPRIDLRNGFRRLWARSQSARKKNKVEGSKDLRSTAILLEERHALDYAIAPRAFIQALSIITTSPELARRPMLEDPDASVIWGMGRGSFDICSILAVISYDTTKPVIWNSTFRYPMYATGSHDGDIEDLFQTREQGRLDKHVMPFIFSGEENMDAPLNRFLYVFPVPSRVVRIPSSRIHPVILSKCLIPAYTTSSRHVKRIKHVEYGGDFDKKLQRLMIPEITDIGLMELAVAMEFLRGDSWRTEKDPPHITFTVDQIRDEKFDAKPMQNNVKYTMVPGKATPIQLLYVVTERLANDFESEHPCAPSAQRAIYAWVKLNRRKSEYFSLFPDVYGDDMGFEYFKDLSVASNFKANIFNLLDNLYCIYQNHKHILHILTLLFLATKMAFGDKLFTLFTGPPEVSKSHIFKTVFNWFAIPGTMEEEGSQTTQSINSGSKDPGMMIFHDDMGANTSPIFTGNHKEIEANASAKASMSNSCTTRKVVSVEKGVRRFEIVFTDNRGSEAGNTNNTKYDLLDSFQSRTMFFECVKLNRGMESAQLDLKKAAFFPGQKADQIKTKFGMMMKCQQAFICIVLQGIRSGAIPYDEERNQEFAHSLHGRFKESLKAMLGADNVTFSLRMENGQLIPIMMGKMLERIYAACVSGVFGEGSPLSIGAKFNFKELLTALAESSLLQFDVSDYIEAISYFNGPLSQESSNVLVGAIRQKIRTKTAIRGQLGSGIVFGQTPIEGNIPTGKPFWATDTAENSWVKHPGIFFHEHQQNNRFARNYNWIDLSALFGLNSLTGASLTTSQILKSLSSGLQDVIGQAYDYHLVVSELTRWQEGLTRQPFLSETVPEEGFSATLKQSPNDEIDSSILKFQFQMAEGARVSSWHILLNSQWLYGKAEKMKQGIAPVSPCCPKFISSAMELALQYLPFKCCHEATYLLPGMTLDRPVEHKGFAMPHIAKTLKMFNANKPSYAKELAAKNLKPLLFYALNAGDGRRMGFAGGGRGIYPGYDCYTTNVHMQIVKAKIDNMGLYFPEIGFVRDSSELKSYFEGWVVRCEYMNFCPVGIEKRFNARREEHATRNNVTLRDYIESMVEIEEKFTKSSQNQELLPTDAWKLLGMRIENAEETLSEYNATTNGGGGGRDYGDDATAEEKDGVDVDGDQVMQEGETEEDPSGQDENQGSAAPEEVVVAVQTAPKRKRTAWDKVRIAQRLADAQDENDRFFYPGNTDDVQEEDPEEGDEDSETSSSSSRKKHMRHHPLIGGEAEEASEEDPEEGDEEDSEEP